MRVAGGSPPPSAGTTPHHPLSRSGRRSPCPPLPGPEGYPPHPVREPPPIPLRKFRGGGGGVRPPRSVNLHQGHKLPLADTAPSDSPGPVGHPKGGVCTCPPTPQGGGSPRIFSGRVGGYTGTPPSQKWDLCIIARVPGRFSGHYFRRDRFPGRLLKNDQGGSDPAKGGEGSAGDPPPP